MTGVLVYYIRPVYSCYSLYRLVSIHATACTGLFLFMLQPVQACFYSCYSLYRLVSIHATACTGLFLFMLHPVQACFYSKKSTNIVHRYYFYKNPLTTREDRNAGEKCIESQWILLGASINPDNCFRAENYIVVVSLEPLPFLRNEHMQMIHKMDKFFHSF